MKREGQVRIPVRMRDLRCDLPGGTPDDGREDRGEHDPHARPLQRSGRRLRAYGIYPEYRDYYAFHIFFDSRDTRKTCEALLKEA